MPTARTRETALYYELGDARAGAPRLLFISGSGGDLRQRPNVFEGPLAENVTVVPRYVMRADDTLLVVDANDRLRIRKVEVLRIDRDEVLIRTDLAPGERICLSPIQVVVEGMPVRPIDEKSASEASS